MKKWFRRYPSREKGQSFLELAISLVFLLVLVTVMIDLGISFFTLIAMRDATQEAAAYGSMCPPSAAPVAYPDASYDKIVTRLKNSASAPLDIKDISNLGITFVDQTGTPLGSGTALQKGVDSIRIQLTVTHQILVPFVPSFIGVTSYPLSVNVSDTILRTTTDGCN